MSSARTPVPGPAGEARRWVVAGVLGVVLALVAGAGLYAATLPWKGTSDSRPHLDYAWRIGHGELPAFDDGIQAPLGFEYPVQFVSQHPPLYHAVLAPLVTGRIDAGHWAEGAAVARAVSIAWAAGCAVALAWSGWVLGGRHRARLAVALPAVATSLVPFVKVAGDVMNDTPALLATVLALTTSVVVLRRGPDRRTTVLLALWCALGMASRATFVSTLVLSLAALVVGALLHGERPAWRRLADGVLRAGAVLATVVATSGWFYLRNHRASGTWHRNSAQSWAAELQDRPHSTLHEVLTEDHLWRMLPEGLFGNPWGRWAEVAGSPFNVALSLVVFGLAVAGAVVVARRGWRGRRFTPVGVAIVGLLAGQVALTYAQQISHATGYGALNVRYLLPSLVPLALVLATGALAVDRLRGAGVVALVVTSWVAVALNLSWYLGAREPALAGHGVVPRLLHAATEQNGVPGVVLALLLVVLVAGVALIATSLWHLTPDREPSTATAEDLLLGDVPLVPSMAVPGNG